LQRYCFMKNWIKNTVLILNPTKIREKNRILLSKWTKFYQNLTPMWESIERKENFTDSDLNKLHKHTATFMCQWIDLAGANHMTNYIHIVGAGHLTYFAKQYGNLYRFSQQGWESLNKLIKHFYYNNTNHGGSNGNGGKDELGNCTKATLSGQHCYPLMRFCQRFMMWTLGYGDKYFERVIKKETALEVLDSFELQGSFNNDESDGLQFGII
jgi:hypothetical protein